MTIDNNAGNFSSGHRHGPSTSFIVLSIEEASNLSDDPNMTGALNSLTKQNLALANHDRPSLHSLIMIDSRISFINER